MSNARRTALNYFRTAPGSLWKWEEDGRVLVWTDGTTLAFRGELDALIQQLGMKGLPAFPSLVLMLAACRGKFPLLQPAGTGNANPGQLELFQALNRRNHERALAELDKIAQLPAELTQKTKGKLFLASTVFENSKFLPQAESAEILASLSETWSEKELNTPEPDASPVDLIAAMWTVAEGVRQHTAESLTLRLKTGLDALPKIAAAIELPPDEKARRLLAELKNDPDYVGLALATRDLMAAIRLPTFVSKIDEFALGGSSSLGNRGSLDRLLLSELAHDDWTLATRIALNEALYIHREPPAVKPERSLVLLLDSGLRMWGLPRVLAVSAALALIASHRSTGAVTLCRAKGNTLETIDLLSRRGLESHLEVLHTELDPRSAFSTLSQKLAEAGDTDFVLLTHRNTFSDPGFLNHLARTELGRSFAVLTDNDGVVQLYPLPWGTPRPFAQTTVNLDQLLAAPPERTVLPLIDRGKIRDLPAIFAQPHFPLLMSINNQVEQSIQTSHGNYFITSDRRLLKTTSPHCGAQQLLTDLPAGKTCALLCDGKGRVIVVKGRAASGQMSVVILPPHATTPLMAKFSGPHHPSATIIDQETLILVLNTRVVAVSLETGEILSESPFPSGMSWINGRYFSPGIGIQFVSWTGHAFHWDDVVSGRSFHKRDVALVFERDAVGAWILLRDGSILQPTGAEFMGLGFRVSGARALQNGNTLLVHQAVGGAQHAVSLAKKESQPVSGPKWEAQLDSAGPPPTRPIQARFQSIHAARGKSISLQKSNGRRFEICCRAISLLLTDPPEKAPMPAEFTRTFAFSVAPTSIGCNLHVASWPGGSKAWLDSRGFLHLRSHDTTVPEISLALNHGEMAAWISGEQSCGNEFFTGSKATANAGRAAEVLGLFCDRLC